MRTYRFKQVDVFTGRPLLGNPVAVVLDAGGISDAQMQPLYLESGPRRKTTMVHVLDLLGCVANGPTTEAALEAAPDAIREYLRFLRRHGAAAEPGAPFTTSIAAHVMEGSWIGYGDPPS